jgi:hypothetical protein
MVFLERLSKRLSESMSIVAACFASVLSVKRTLSCKTEDQTLRVDQPLDSYYYGGNVAYMNFNLLHLDLYLYSVVALSKIVKVDRLSPAN